MNKITIGKILSLTEGPFEPDGRINTNAASIIPALDELLLVRNGFFMYDRAIRFFPTTDCKQSLGLQTWNSNGLWKKSYGNLTVNKYFFAEDVFGNQFYLNDSGVHSFDAESAESNFLCNSIEELLELLISDGDLLTGRIIADKWKKKFGAVEPLNRLVPNQFFVLGGEFSIKNLKSVNSVLGMQTRGPIAQKIYTLPDNTEVEFTVKDE
jgi:hypothetical protein